MTRQHKVTGQLYDRWTAAITPPTYEPPPLPEDPPPDPSAPYIAWMDFALADPSGSASFNLVNAQAGDKLFAIPSSHRPSNSWYNGFSVSGGGSWSASAPGTGSMGLDSDMVTQHAGLTWAGGSGYTMSASYSTWALGIGGYQARAWTVLCVRGASKAFGIGTNSNNVPPGDWLASDGDPYGYTFGLTHKAGRRYWAVSTWGYFNRSGYMVTDPKSAAGARPSGWAPPNWKHLQGGLGDNAGVVLAEAQAGATFDYVNYFGMSGTDANDVGPSRLLIAADA